MRKMTERNRIVWMAVWLFVLLPALWAQEAAPLPIDSKVRYGQLDNGLTYYIRHNELPKGRADFYIVHNVGSVLEEENQRGLAHFLEHMAFDGSKHFPNDGMDHYIESVGMRGGENFNAYTSFDETVYMVMNAPVDKPAVTDSCLLILHDWTGFLSLTDSAIAKERGVIREEWRTRQDAQARLWEQQLPKMYPGSRYANRMPIGTIEVIENFKPDELRAYYRKWYRPDQQAIIVVGDVDMAEVEGKVRELFGAIPAPVNPAERKEAEVPDNAEPLVSVATDKEAANTILFLFYKHDNLPKERRATIEGAVHNYVQSICASVMAERFDAIVRQPNPPFIYAEGYDSDNYMVARTKGAWTTAAMVKDNAVDSALFALVRENERVRQFGFTKGEYDRAKANLLKSYESAYNEREKQPNSAYSREYLSHFTEGGYIPGIEMEYELMRQIAQELPLEAINQYVARVISERNIVISLTGPDKADVTYPTEAELLAMFEKARLQPVEPYRETVSNEPLIPSLPTPGKIVKSEEGLLGSTVLTLGNGVRVVLKPTTLKRDQVLLSASSPGGSSLYGPDEIVNLKVFNDVIELGGLGDFSAIDLQKRLAGKEVGCSLSLSMDRENVNGSAVPADLKTLFELVYLSFTAPRRDNDAFESYKGRMVAQLRNAELDPMTAFSDSLMVAIYGDNPRARRLRPADFDRVSYDRILEIGRERFGDASGFTFMLVGSFEVDSVRPYIEQYLATLPAAGRVEQADVNQVPKPRTGEFANRFSRPMETPKVSVLHYYSGQMDYTLADRVAATMLEQVLDLVYMEKVREAEGGTYGVSASVSISSFPEGQAGVQVYFDTDPNKWERMSEITATELRRIADEGPREVDFNKTRDNLLKRFAENQQGNEYWLAILGGYYYRGFDAYTDYEATVRGMTPDKVRAFAKRLLDQGNHTEVIMSAE